VQIARHKPNEFLRLVASMSSPLRLFIGAILFLNGKSQALLSK